MCTSLAQYQMTQDAGVQPASSPQSASMIQTGGAMQSGAAALAGLGDLAAGVVRSRTLKAQANAEKQAGLDQASRVRRAGEATLSSARAAATAANVSVGSGSVLEAERAIVRGVETDAGVAILNGQMRAAGLQEQAGYALAGGLNSFGDSMFTAGDKWQRSRRATQQPTIARQGVDTLRNDNLA